MLRWVGFAGTVLVLLPGCGSADLPPPDGAAVDAGHVSGDAGADGGIPPGSWTIVVLPDTQILARDHREIFESQTRWIVEQRDAWRIAFAVHVGDIVDDNSDAQWDVASDALHALDGEVPYVLAPGNHDYGAGGSAADRSTLLNTYFPVSTFASEPWFGGSFEEGTIENTYSVFETPSEPWLVVALEFGPRDAVLAWADEVIGAHAPMRALVVTHAYLYSDDTRYDWLTRPDQLWNPHSYGLAALGGVNDGEEMFDALVRRHDSIDFVVCGHVLNDGLGRLTSEQDGGGRVHQLLANYQHQELGGAGFLRLMTLDPEGARVTVRTYSPYLDEWRTDGQNEFVLDL